MTPQPEPPAPAPGGAIVAPGFNAPASLWRCCASMQSERTGECADGCCDSYRCKNCGRTWTYEWPD